MYVFVCVCVCVIRSDLVLLPHFMFPWVFLAVSWMVLKQLKRPHGLAPPLLLFLCSCGLFWFSSRPTFILTLTVFLHSAGVWSFRAASCLWISLNVRRWSDRKVKFRQEADVFLSSWCHIRTYLLISQQIQAQRKLCVRTDPVCQCEVVLISLEVRTLCSRNSWCLRYFMLLGLFKLEIWVWDETADIFNTSSAMSLHTRGSFHLHLNCDSFVKLL